MVKLFAYYPRGVRTGGPEAIHQLVAAAREYGYDAFLVPLPHTRGREYVAEYARYGLEEVDSPSDEESVLVVAPETHFDILRALRRATSVCWWLSVDNSPWYLPNPGTRTIKGSYHRRWAFRDRWLQSEVMVRAVHWTQSEYAWSFVHSRFGKVPHLVSDYIDFGEAQDVLHPDNPLPRVGFYPKKGGALARSIIEKAAESQPLLPVPLEGYSRDELQAVLRGLDVYVDAGHHPGRDRLPREAAASGAVTITSRRGAAGYVGDVPVDSQFKWSPGTNEVAVASRVLIDTLARLETAREAQEPYRRWILDAPTRFRREVSDALGSRPAQGRHPDEWQSR